MSNTWNLNGYQYDDTGYNYDSFEVAPFESEQGAYMSVCALANYSDGMTSGMGNVNAGSVQNVDLSSMNSHKACLGGLGSTLGSTMGRMGASLNARFKAEVEAGTLFGGQQIPADSRPQTTIPDSAMTNYTETKSLTKTNLFQSFQKKE